jgi:hypothetical protein
MFKNLFKAIRGDGEAPELPRLLGLRIGATVDIDTIPIRMLADELNFELPDATKIIVAQGAVELGEGSVAYRYYAADDTMIQVMTVGGADDAHVEEVTLYVPHDSFYPSTAAEWKQWTGTGGSLGAPEFRLADGTRYVRIWFEDTEGWAAPVEFTETVHGEADGGDTEDIRQKVMLYGRGIDNDRRAEYLLLSVEDSDGEATVELMIGTDLDPATMKVF